MNLETALWMEVTGEEEGDGDGTLMVLGSTGFLTQEAELSGTTLIYVCNGLNKISRLVILLTFWHRWTVGARFALNFYKHWAEIILLQLRGPLVMIQRQEGVNRGYPLLVVLYGITLIP